MKNIIKKSKSFFQIVLTICLSFLLVNINVTSAFAEANEKKVDVLCMSNNEIDVQSSSNLSDSIDTLASRTMYSNRHSYNSLVYDGGLYYLSNVKSGKYLDLDHGYTESGTNILGWRYNGNDNQKFYFKYLGMNLYEIVPYSTSTTQVILHATGTDEDANIEIRSKNRSINQKFKLQMIDNGKAVIYTQVSNFKKALYYNASNNNITQKDYASLSSNNKAYAQWTFSEIDPSVYSSYQKYFIKNVNTGLYLDAVNKGVSNSTSVQARIFTGSENQQWKFVYDFDNKCYYFKPMHRTDMALDAYSTNLVIYSDTFPSDQGLKIEFVDCDESFNLTYRISTRVTNYSNYLNIGNNVGTSETQKYVTKGTNANDLWILEEVPYDSTDMEVLSVNTTYSKGFSSYGENQTYIFRSNVDSRYKVELTRTTGYAIMGVFTDKSANVPDFCNVYNVSNGQVFDVFFAANKNYYLYVFDEYNNLDSKYTLRVRQLTATYHSHTFPNDINLILDSSNNMNLYIDTKHNMTVSRAKNETNALTGRRDFDSEIFVYSGHGSAGYACYDGLSLLSWFGASELPDMSNCELAIWDCCESNKKYIIRSLVSESLNKGAKTVIGWTESIPAASAEKYMDRLFEQLTLGLSVKEASNNSIAQNSFAATNAIVSSISIQGNVNNIIYPIDTYSYEINSFESDAILRNKEDYSLVNENIDYGVKLYSRLINGIPTDDYYLEFYNDDKLIGTYKSNYTLSNSVIASIIESSPQIENVGLTFTDQSNLSLSYTYINGELRLVEKREVVTIVGELTYIDYWFYDLETNEVLVL